MKLSNWSWIGAAALALAGCGGSEKVDFEKVVSFGDSISDPGAYQVGTVAALGGGRFTVNGPDGLVWTEVLAAELDTPAQCAARTGLLPNAPGITGAPVTDVPGCFNYAQGSSRVTSEGSGPNGVALQAFGDVNIGLIANSLSEQFNRHLNRAGGGYTGRELVTINSGGNDAFMQLNAVGAAAGGGAAAVGAGTIAGWPQSVLDTVALGGAAATNAAAGAAVAAMQQAGGELAGYIKTLVVARGARYVIVRNLGDLNVTPYGLTLDAATRSLITNMTVAFNTALSNGLAGTAGVLIYDDYALSADIAANPAAWGFTNITTPACGPNPFSGQSLVCNTTNLIAGDTSRYAFSDGVHPSPYAHQKAAEYAHDLLHDAGWH